MELKEQIRSQLVKNKEIELQKEIEQNSKLEGIEVYTNPENPTVKSYIEDFDAKGLKYTLKNIGEHISIYAVVGTNTHMVLKANNEHIVMGRDFHSPKAAIQILRNIAHPDFIAPDNATRTVEMLKNMNMTINKKIGQLQNSLQPVIKLMQDLAKEEEEIKKEEKKVIGPKQKNA
tara:strand:- start:53 stop:577 length:525 start_codon:yes stop_codon:yes gene_type:complete